MLPGKKLHIIALNIPFPPNYGGVIDIFYKIKALAAQGIGIYLHCFYYGRGKTKELDKYCEKVFYYKRKTGVNYALKKLPYIVAGRDNSKLLKNLENIKAPILFEGLHTTFFINHPKIRGYYKILRTHNVEHHYYHNLAIVEPNMIKRFYYKSEAKKLEAYEKVINHANLLISISPSDHEYFKNKHHDVKYIPAFHSNEKVISKEGKGNYFLFHGSLNVGENINAVEYLVSEVFNQGKHKLIIAGKSPVKKIRALAKENKNIELAANPTAEKMEGLIQNAQACVLPTFQATGLKLKLLSSLYIGRFCIVNKPMVENTGLENLCIVSNTASEMKKALTLYSEKQFTDVIIKNRKQVLFNNFSNKFNAQKLSGYIFKGL